MSYNFNDHSIYLVKLYLNMISADDQHSEDLKEYYTPENIAGFGLEPNFLEAYISVLKYIDQHILQSHILKFRVKYELQRAQKIYEYTALKYNLHNLKRGIIVTSNQHEKLSQNLIALQNKILSDLEAGEEITYPAGWMGSDEVGGHSLYVSVKRSSTKNNISTQNINYRVRIFNLGDGVELFQQIYSLSDTVGYYHANIIGKDNITKFINGIISNDFNGTTKENVEYAKRFLYKNDNGIYVDNTRKAQSKHTEDLQDIGNCIVKNFFFATRNSKKHNKEKADEEYAELFLHIIAATLGQLRIATYEKNKPKDYERYLKRVSQFIKETQTVFAKDSIASLGQRLDNLVDYYSISENYHKQALCLTDKNKEKKKAINRTSMVTNITLFASATVTAIGSLIRISTIARMISLNPIIGKGVSLIGIGGILVAGVHKLSVIVNNNDDISLEKSINKTDIVEQKQKNQTIRCRR